MKNYIKPEITVKVFEANDIVTASGGAGESNTIAANREINVLNLKNVTFDELEFVL